MLAQTGFYPFGDAGGHAPLDVLFRYDHRGRRWIPRTRRIILGRCRRKVKFVTRRRNLPQDSSTQVQPRFPWPHWVIRDERFSGTKEVLTTGEVAKICNVAARTVSKWFDKGDIEGYRIRFQRPADPETNLIKFMKHTSRWMADDRDHPGAGRRKRCGHRDTLLKVLGDNTGYELRGAKTHSWLDRVRTLRPTWFWTPPCQVAEIVQAMQANEDRTLTSLRSVVAPLIRNETYLRKGYAGCIRKPFTVRQVIDAIEDCTSIIHWLPRPTPFAPTAL